MLRRLLLPALLAAGLLIPASAAHAEAGPIQTTITSGIPWAPDSTPTFSFKSDRPDSEFTCVIDWTTIDCGDGLNANEILTYTSSVLSHGNHTFKVSACWEDHSIGDSACDPTPAVMNFELDLEGPETTFILDSTPDNTRLQGKPRYRLDGADIFAGWFKCYLDGVQIQGCDDWDQKFETIDISEGRHEFTVHGTDSYGNFGPLAKRVFFRDTTGPDVSFTSKRRTNDTTPEITFDAPHDGGAPYTAQCKLDGAQVPCAWGSYQVPNTLTEGGHTFAVQARDGLGNLHTATPLWIHHEFTVDTTAPVIKNVSYSAAAKQVTFALDGATDASCSLDGAPAVACTSPYDVSALAAGAHTLKIHARDDAGNDASDEVSFDIPAPSTPGPRKDEGAGTTPPAGTAPAPAVTAPAPVIASRASTATTKKSTCAATKKKAAKKTKKKAKSKTKKAKASACKSAAKKKPAKKAKKKKSSKKSKR